MVKRTCIGDQSQGTYYKMTVDTGANNTHLNVFLRNAITREEIRAVFLDDDIRQTFSRAVPYNIPAPGAGLWKSVFGNWLPDRRPLGS